MPTITAVIRNGRLELSRPLDLPDGTEVEIQLPDVNRAELETQPMNAAEIVHTLAAMDQVELFEMTDAERAAQEADRQARNDWEKAR
jgi:hypothetical protein